MNLAADNHDDVQIIHGYVLSAKQNALTLLHFRTDTQRPADVNCWSDAPRFTYLEYD